MTPAGPTTSAATFHWRERLKAPAKVNLLLLVGPRLPDGYHEVLSVMAPLDLHDSLEVDVEAAAPVVGAAAPSAGPVVASSAAPVAAAAARGAAGSVQVEVVCPGVASASNLAQRALAAVAAATGCAFRGRIQIVKRIPMAAGLGGGSSDAAAVLAGAAAAAHAACGHLLHGEELQRLAASLGADVPFFLGGGCQVASGIGDRLQPIALPALPLLLVLPEEELSTALVYRAYDDAVGNEGLPEFRRRAQEAVADWRHLEEGWTSGALAEAAARRLCANLLRNDLERAGYRLVPDLMPRRFMLEGSGAMTAMMSGSGPSMYGVFADEEAAERACVEADSLGRESVPAWTLP